IFISAQSDYLYLDDQSGDSVDDDGYNSGSGSAIVEVTEPVVKVKTVFAAPEAEPTQDSLPDPSTTVEEMFTFTDQSTEIAETETETQVPEQSLDVTEETVISSEAPPSTTTVIAGGVIGLLFAVFLILLLVYRMRKKDEGSYVLGERKAPSSAYQKAPTKDCLQRSTGGKPFPETAKEIASYAKVAQSIIDLAVYGKAQNRSYERLADFTDTIGNRVSGSKNLDLAIKYMFNALRKDGLENVHLEPVKIPHWVRGEERAVLVVESFEELKKRQKEASGKIVVYNQPFVSYEETVQYRESGASKAAKVGAVATLIRSVTPFSINSPHTGWQDYEEGVQKIPTACITVEDAMMMARMAKRGQRIVVRLTMNAQTFPDADSFNTVSEIIGSEHPEQ
ncbi:unnamed protein product, partial [Coregonus sp. 'balchen']